MDKQNEQIAINTVASENVSFKAANRLETVDSPLKAFPVRGKSARNRWLGSSKVQKLVIFTALFLTLLLSSQNSRTSSGTIDTMAPKKVIIIFHGLMVGQLDRTDTKHQVFKIGAVKGAGRHLFNFSVSDGSFTGSPSAVFPPNGTFYFQVQGRDNNADYKTTSFKDRHSPTQPTKDEEKDYRYLINLRELHPTASELDYDANSLGPNFMVKDGQIMGRCATVPLKVKRSSGATDDYGRLSEVIAVEISLHEGETIILQSSAGTHIWERPFNQIVSEIEVYVTYLPKSGNPNHLYPYPCMQTSLTQAQAKSDFDIFYDKVFTKVKDRASFQLGADTKKALKQLYMTTVPTYRCGGVIIEP